MGGRITGLVLGVVLGFFILSVLHFMTGDKDMLVSLIRSIGIIFFHAFILTAVAWATDRRG